MAGQQKNQNELPASPDTWAEVRKRWLGGAIECFTTSQVTSLITLVWAQKDARQAARPKLAVFDESLLDIESLFSGAKPPPPRYIGPRSEEERVKKATKRSWMLAMSNSFVDSIKKIDGKLRGRVLECLSHLSRDPMSLKGDTVKPLGGELKGWWRYRLGDYRLIYAPDQDRMEILLVDFVPRGGAYD